MLGEGRPGPPAAAGTLSFLFADLRDYTAFVEAHGDAAAAALIEDFRRLVRAQIARAGGGEIKTEGDSFYIVFPSASQALQAGLDILQEAELASRRRPDRPLRIGVGIHAGEPVPHQGQYVGSAVNIAARLAQNAGPGELLVSELVRGLVRTSRAPAMEERAGVVLKGVKDPPRIYSVAVAAPAPGTERGIAAEPDEVAIPAQPPRDLRILCSQLIGREKELSALVEQLHMTIAGRGGTVLVAGDAGLGKTATVRAFAEQAAAQGVCVLVGECTEVEARRPFAPFIDIARAAAEEVPSAEPSGLLETSFLRGGPGALEPLAEMERYRVHAAFAQLLSEVAAAGPLVVIVDDLHWADEATLELFPYLARKLREHPVLLVGTYRIDELHRLHPINRMLAELGRTRLAAEVRLKPLTLDETGAVIRATLQLEQPPTAEFRAAVHERCGGNPFFTEEVLRVLVERGDLAYREGAWHRTKAVLALAIPSSVRDSVQERMRELSVDAQRAIQVAAVIGQRFDFDLLRRVSGLDEGALLQALRAGIDTQLIDEGTDGDGDEEYVFRHALTRESVLAELLKRERRLLHRAVGEAIEAGLGPGSAEKAEELAYHFDQAHDRERARTYHELAAADALGLFGFARAVQHLERALDLAPDDDPALGELELRLAVTAYNAGDMARAGRAAEEARRRFQLEGNLIGVGAALTQLSRSRWDVGDSNTAEEFTAEAIAILEPLGDCPELAAAYARASGLAMLDHRDEDAIAVGRKALAVAERTGALEAQVNALIAVGTAVGHGDSSGMQLLRESLELAHRHEYPVLAARAYNNLYVSMRTWESPAEDVTRLLVEFQEHARRYGLRYEPLITHTCLAAFLEGEWDEALNLVEEERSDSIWSAGRELNLAFILTARHGPERRKLADAPRRRLLEAGDAQWRAIAAGAAATMLLAEDFDAAIEYADAAADLAEDSSASSFLGISIVCAVLAARAAGRRDAVERWIEISLNSPKGGPQQWRMARQTFAKAERAFDQGQLDAAIDFFARCAHHFTEAFWWSKIVGPWVRMRRAEALLERDHPGDRDSAQAELDAIVPFWRKAKADWYLGRLEAWAGERGMRLPKS